MIVSNLAAETVKNWAFSSLGEELKHLKFHEISWNHPDLKRWKPWNNRETQLHTIVYNTGTALRILKITILGTNIAIFAVGHVFVLLAPSLEMRNLIRDLHKFSHMSAAMTLGTSWTAVPMLSQSNTSHAHSLKLEYSNRRFMEIRNSSPLRCQLHGYLSAFYLHSNSGIFKPATFTGWWFQPTPLKNIASSVGIIISNNPQDIWKKMFQTTNQIYWLYCYSHY